MPDIHAVTRKGVTRLICTVLVSVMSIAHAAAQAPDASNQQGEAL